MRLFLILGLTLALGACASTHHAEPEPAEEPVAEDPGPAPDLPGNWYAVEVVGDSTATADIEAGVLDIVLIIRPDRRVIYTGVDRAASDRAFSYGGEVVGNTIHLQGLSGTAEISFSGQHLHLTDPGGRVTVFEKGP